MNRTASSEPTRDARRTEAPLQEPPAPYAPLYDLPELRSLNDALWAEIRDRLAARGWDAPATLSRGLPDWDAVLLAQTCGYRYMNELAGRVTLVATPRYLAPGTDGPFVRSAVVVRRGDAAAGLIDLRDRCLAYDAADLNSINLLRSEVAPLARTGRHFGALAPTASFVSAAEAVVEYDADAALLDGIALAHLNRLRPTTARELRVLTWTTRSPGPPFVTARTPDPAAVAAQVEVLGEIERESRLRPLLSALLVKGFNPLPKAQYRAVSYLEQIARSQGYAVLR